MRSAEIRAHLAECSGCASARDRVELENRLYGQFFEQTAVEPGAEMWEAIRESINAEPRQPADDRRGGLRESLLAWLLAPAVIRQAAFAILLIALSVAATVYFVKRGGDGSDNLARRDAGAQTTPSPQPSAAPAKLPESELAGTAPAPSAQSPVVKPQKPGVRRTGRLPRQLTEQETIDRQLARVEREYESAIDLLEGAIARRRDTLDPAVVRQYEASLALIDDSIASSRRALRSRPDDLIAGQFLLASYAKKVDLMRDIALR